MLYMLTFFYFQLGGSMSRNQFKPIETNWQSTGASYSLIYSEKATWSATDGDRFFFRWLV